MEDIAGKNVVFPPYFQGGQGAYNHYIPANCFQSVSVKRGFVNCLYALSGGNQPGHLQSIFEYQTMICELTGMDASNASIYDGATGSGRGSRHVQGQEEEHCVCFRRSQSGNDRSDQDILILAAILYGSEKIIRPLLKTHVKS